MTNTLECDIMSGIKFIRPLDKFQPPTKCWCSPSGLGVDTGCMRQLLINSFFRHDGMYESSHTKFGSALGAACAALVQHYDLPQWKRMAIAYDAARMFFQPADDFMGKTWSKLWRCMRLFDAQWAYKHKARWLFHSAEVKTTLKITEVGFSTRYLTGAYDLKVYRKVNNSVEYKIIDFKAVSSLYYYNYETDTQTPIYMLLDYIAGVAKGDHRSYSLPEYCVFELGKDDIKLDMSITPVLPTVISTSLFGSLATHRLACQYGSQLGMMVKQGSNSLNALWDSIPASISQCKRGAFKCFQYSVCHEGQPINFDVPRYDDDSDLGLHIMLTSSELTQLTHDLAAKFATQETISNSQDTLDDFGGFTLDELLGD